MAETIYVEKLTYSLLTPSPMLFDNPEPIIKEYEDFTAILEQTDEAHTDGKLTIQFKDKKYFKDIEEAKSHVKDFVLAWEAEIILKHNLYGTRFKYKNAGILKERADGSLAHQYTRRPVSAECPMSRNIQAGAYPSPPEKFQFSSTVRIMLKLLETYKKGSARLTDIGYTCLTILEKEASDICKCDKKSCENKDIAEDHHRQNRCKASRKFKISLTILNDFGYLTSVVGNEETSRKANPKRDFGVGEEKWMEDFIKLSIRRVGRYAFAPKARLALLTEKDLPALPEKIRQTTDSSTC